MSLMNDLGQCYDVEMGRQIPCGYIQKDFPRDLQTQRFKITSFQILILHVCFFLTATCVHSNCLTWCITLGHENLQGITHRERFL